MAVCFDENDARVMGRNARGVRGIRLASGDRVVGVCLVEDGKNLLTVTEKGFGKRSEFEEYSVHNRGVKGVRCHGLSDKTGRLVGIASVDDDMDLLMMSDSGVLIRLALSSIPSYGRSAGGVILMRTGEGRVVNFTTVRKDDGEEPSDGEESDTETLPDESAPDEETTVIEGE